MDNLSKKDIDYIFQKGTSRQEFTFKESSWNNMEAMLDADDRKRNIKWFLIITILLLSILGISIFFISKNDEPVTRPELTSIDFKNEVKNEVKNDISINKKSILTNKLNTLNASDEKLNSKGSENIKSAETIPSSEFIRSIDNNVSNQSSNIENTVLNQNGNFKPTQITTASTTKKLKGNEVSQNISNTPLNIELVEAENIDKDRATAISNLSIVSIQPIIDNTAFNSFEKPVLSSMPKINKLSYSLLIGQEWSTVSDMKEFKPGYKVGAELAYQFGRRFQISSGVNLSLKKYKTAGTNYNALQTRVAWADDVAPETVDAKCTVLEIPVEFTYYFKNYQENGWFLGAGLSSYIMASEWYDFSFQPDYQDKNQLFWTTDNNEDMKMKSHYASILTAQFGYQHKISNNFNIQFAPYVQLPFGGIGHGDIDVMSGGIQVKIGFQNK